MQDSFPTCSSVAQQRPDTTKLPENRRLPASFLISSASPVRRDSFTDMQPCMTLASAQIWFPEASRMQSPFTSSSEGMRVSLPSRMTIAQGAFSMFILSRVLLARSSCRIPTPVLMMMMGRKVRFLQEPTMQSRTARIKNMRLKQVNRLDDMIFRTLLPVRISVRLESPLAALSSASAVVSPAGRVFVVFVMSLSMLSFYLCLS